MVVEQLDTELAYTRWCSIRSDGDAPGSADARLYVYRWVFERCIRWELRTYTA